MIKKSSFELEELAGDAAGIVLPADSTLADSLLAGEVVAALELESETSETCLYNDEQTANAGEVGDSLEMGDFAAGSAKQFLFGPLWNYC